MKNRKEAKKSTSNLIIGILVVIVLILAFSWMDSVPQSSDTDMAQNDDQEQMGNDRNSDESSSQTFDGFLPDDWALTERAENGINTLTSGQKIDFSIIQDPSDENVVYFSAHSFDDGDGLMQIGVYKYRTDNYNFERLFRRSYNEGSIDGLPTTEFPVFHVVGYDNGALVLLVQGESDSPGPCAEPILLPDSDGRLLWSMSIEDPYGGFEEYTLPSDVRMEAQEMQETCLEEMP